MSGPRVAVVGHCASGKSTVVRLLTERGIDAYSVAQEHSIINDLWQHQQPDVVVVLDVSLDTIRSRKENREWPEWIYAEQSKRLEHAREHADLIIDTDEVSAEDVASEVSRFVSERCRT